MRCNVSNLTCLSMVTGLSESNFYNMQVFPKFSRYDLLDLRYLLRLTVASGFT